MSFYCNNELHFRNIQVQSRNFKPCTCWNIHMLLCLWLLIILLTNKYPICAGWNYKTSLQAHVFWCHCTNGIVRFCSLQISSPNIPCVSSQTCLPDVCLSYHGNANQFPIRPENEFSRHMMSQCMTSPTFTPAYNGPTKFSFRTLLTQWWSDPVRGRDDNAEIAGESFNIFASFV
jgi:hypothetical protein